MNNRTQIAEYLRGLAERLAMLGEEVAGAKDVLDATENATYRAVPDFLQLGNVERGLAQAAAELMALAEQLETKES